MTGNKTFLTSTDIINYLLNQKTGLNKDLVIKSYIAWNIFLAFIFVFVSNLNSQELEPRNYSVLPKNLNGIAVGYSLSSGAIVTDATSPLSDFSVVSHSVMIGAVRTFSLFGKLARIQAILPFVYMSGDVKVNGRDTSGTKTGLGDPRIRIGVNILGSPVLSPNEYQKFKEETVLGASLVVSLPAGNYDNSKLVNLGSNRWGFKPEIGFSYAYDRFYFELFGGVWLFTSNNEFLQTKKMKQDPIYSVQAHALYVFSRGIWFGVNGNYFYGGKSQIDGIYRDDIMKNSRIGCVLGYSINAFHSFKLQAHTGIETASGSSYSIFSLVYQFIWF